jgi:hypothetical protein
MDISFEEQEPTNIPDRQFSAEERNSWEQEQNHHPPRQCAGLLQPVPTDMQEQWI